VIAGGFRAAEDGHSLFSSLEMHNFLLFVEKPRTQENPLRRDVPRRRDTQD
jgi:hypothetical protein